MFATDFLFDNHRASDFGLMICSFDGNTEPASGGEIEYNTVKPPGSDRFSFYGAQFNSAIEWHFSICKDPNLSRNPYFTQYEESKTAKWLLPSDGYKLFSFSQEGYEDIFYYAYVNMTPHQILGQTVGFDLTVTSDCAYGFTGIITQKAILNKSAPSLEFHIQSDVNTCILPRIRIKSTGNFHISNVNDFGHPETIFKNLPADQSLEFIMNSDTDTIFIQKAGVTAPLPDPNMFNWHFLRLVNGKNQI